MAVTVRAFGLRDVSLVHSLQRSGAPIDLESAVVEPSRPLSVAVNNYFSAMLRQQKRMTYVLRGQAGQQRLAGFVQVAARESRPELDIVFLAPTLGSGGETAVDTWREMLVYACQQAGAGKRQRIFARLPAGDSDAIEVFRQVGFTVYAQENIFQLPRLPLAFPPAALTLRPYESRDEWAVQRLACHAAPRQVQQVECLSGPGWAMAGLSHQRKPQRFVWEHEGEVRGYVGVYRGFYGHWLKLLVDYDHSQRADELVSRALAQIGPSHRPVYCGVRGYEPGLQHAAQRIGFRLHTALLCLVKLTVVPIKEPVLNWLSVPERGVEAAPTASQLHAKVE